MTIKNSATSRLSITSMLTVGYFLGLTATCLLAFSSTASAGLVGHWTFDNQDLDESSGFRADGVHDGLGTNVQYTNLTPDGSPFALDLTNNGYVRVKNSNQQVNGSGQGGANGTYQDTFDAHFNSTGAMSLSFWGQNLPDGQWEPFISHRGEVSAGYQVRRSASTQEVTFTMRSANGNDDPVSSFSLNDNDWHHYTAVWSSEERALYVDNVKVLSVAGSNSYGAPTFEYVVFGARDNNGGIEGVSNVRLDDIRFYDNVLRTADIEAISGIATPMPEFKSLQFDVGDNVGSYTGTEAPAQANGALDAGDSQWNTVVGDTSGVMSFSDGTSTVMPITVDFGRQEFSTGSISWNVFDDTESQASSPGGVTDTSLMEDWHYTTNNDNLGVRVQGLAAGEYDVYALVREPNQPGRTYSVAIGTDFDDSTIFDVDANQIDPGLFQHDIVATDNNGILNWTEGNNFVMQRLSISGPDEWVVIIVDPTNAPYGTLEGFQIVAVQQVPEPTTYALGLFAAAALGVVVWRRHKQV